MAEERLIGEDKHPFVLFSSVSAEPLRKILQSDILKFSRRNFYQLLKCLDKLKPSWMCELVIAVYLDCPPSG
ncbi:hypothetical protein PFLUV_G00221700 [Perca fluviatilis]|uniref:Uncharacterized protein n=1 Tax=Perca fluviatilis TaxID=8168 RepID=A0A6A5EHT8_PERFL|nr:hypothetical protein PFLUV_G00221700 [Perca fluviatilis]